MHDLSKYQQNANREHAEVWYVSNALGIIKGHTLADIENCM